MLQAVIALKKSQIIALVIAVLGIFWIGSGVLMPPPTEEKAKTITEQSAEKTKLPEVRVRELEAQDFTYDIIVTGRSEADARVDLKAEVAGQVMALHFDKGDVVKQGDLLADIAVDDRKARLKEAQQLVNQRQTQYNAAKTLQEKGFSSRIRLDEASAQLGSAKAALENAKSQLDKTSITAPVDGIINNRVINAGDYVAMGDTTFTIVNLDPLTVGGYVAERQIGEIKNGTKASAEFLDGSKIEGSVSFIASAANEEARTFRIEIKADNKDGAIRDGLTATIRIPAAERKAYKISPSILSLNEEGKIGVKIVDDQDVVAFKPVKILSDKSEFMWIGGLPDKLRLITVGQEFVKDGQKVSPKIASGDGLL